MQKMKPNWVEGKSTTKSLIINFTSWPSYQSTFWGFLSHFFLKIISLWVLFLVFFSFSFLGLWMPKTFRLLLKEKLFKIEAFLYYFLGLPLGEVSFTSTIVKPPITKDILITRQFSIFCSFLNQIEWFLCGQTKLGRDAKCDDQRFDFLLESVFFFCSSIASECKNSTAKILARDWLIMVMICRNCHSGEIPAFSISFASWEQLGANFLATTS
jgi:hypothetical protein